MRIAIVEDQKYWRDCAEKFVRQYYGDKKIDIDIYESGKSYLEKGELYDISLVDIEMPVIDGFETITKARKYNPEGIFIILTTHLEMSRKGYHVNAFRYLDKTNLEEELNEALDSAQYLLERYDKIQVNVVGEGKQDIVLKNIIYIETDKHRAIVHTANGVIRCTNSMAEIETALSGKWFYRSHNAYIINLDEIKCLKGTIVVMSDGRDLDVSKRRFLQFKKAYMTRQFQCANG